MLRILFGIIIGLVAINCAAIDESGESELAYDYESCGGGDNYKGPTQCSDGFKCQVLNPDYHVCLPFLADSDEVPHYGLCGGENYSGPNKCTSGLSCESTGETYSQCLSPEDVEQLKNGYHNQDHSEYDPDKAMDFQLCGGGDDYKGPTQCSAGFKCQVLHPVYHICLPFSADSDEVPHYGLCGGANYSGSTKCAGKLACKYMDDLYSVCLEENEEYF